MGKLLGDIHFQIKHNLALQDSDADVDQHNGRARNIDNAAVRGWSSAKRIKIGDFNGCFQLCVLLVLAV